MNINYANIKVQNIKAGQFFKMSYVTTVETSAKAKKEGVTVLKRTIGTFRLGINYKNTKKAIAYAAEKGKDINEESKLPWGQWKDDSKRIIVHTNKAGQYNEYLRVYDTPNKPKIQYYINNRPVSKEELMKSGYVRASYFNPSKIYTGCSTINLTNIEWIGKPIQ